MRTLLLDVVRSQKGLQAIDDSLRGLTANWVGFPAFTPVREAGARRQMECTTAGAGRRAA